MALSDEEEGEILQHYVNKYWFDDDKQEPVSFSSLPVSWDDNKDLVNSGLKAYLTGKCDGGLRKIYMEVVAWKFELCYALPEISVLTKDKNWMILQKPSKMYEGMIRETLVTVHWLHYVKKNPDAPEESVWNYLLKTFCSYVDKPSRNDLLAQMELINETARRDKDLAASMSFITLVGKCQSGLAFHEDVQTPKKSNFIVDMDDSDGSAGEEVEEQDREFKSVCEICDDGGEVLSCEGRCLRSFHPTIADGLKSQCKSLGYSNKKEVDAIHNFLCKNCQYQQHQCYACGKLASSAKSSCQEVFPCVSATCGRFYHPKCVSKLLHTGNGTQAEELRHRIAAGESFTCPSHKCFACKQVEDENFPDLQFAICRRCPKAYHRKCLPWGILMERKGNNLQRAWGGVLPNQRILIYCLDHEIDRRFSTPPRNHLIFPDIERKNEKQTSELLSRKNALPLKQKMASEDADIDRTAVKRLRVGVEIIGSTKKMDRRRPVQYFNTCTKSLWKTISSVSHRDSTADGFYQRKSKQQNVTSIEIKNTVPDRTVMKEVDSEMENRIMALMKDATSSFDAEEFKRKHIPSTYAYRSNNALDKSITSGLVDCYVKAVRAALQKLENGGSIEDAKAVCGPETLKQIFRWKIKLRVYLAPFLHGLRYTSFGRHFTKMEKLEEIVDRLHWYVQDGDTIVDFCCGSNDFSCLMKQKLEKTRKSCSFKNYDIIRPKNDFCFERRDWMKVNIEELPDSSSLIIGLNPPFGLNAQLANQFISKALEFKPKLIVLITPKETKRLDKKARYDLIWEDDALLSGKSFYLPGSADVNGKQIEDWNVNTPPLYLWSRADWTAWHIAIARERGHVSEQHDNYFSRGKYACDGFPNHFSVPQGNRRLVPEGIRAPVAGQQRKGRSVYVDGKGWETHGNLNGMQNEGRNSTESVLLGENDEAIPLEADDMYINMDISPIISPHNFTGIHSNLVSKPPEAHNASGIVAGD